MYEHARDSERNDLIRHSGVPTRRSDKETTQTSRSQGSQCDSFYPLSETTHSESDAILLSVTVEKRPDEVTTDKELSQSSKGLSCSDTER